MELIIRRARVRGLRDLQDVGILGGRVHAVAEQIREAGTGEIDANGRLLTPGFANIHCHLDKCLTGSWAEVWGESGSGSPEAIPAATRIKERFTEQDIAERASTALSASLVAGTVAARAFADVDTVGGLRSVRSLLRVKDKFRGALDVQVVAFPQEGIIRDEGTRELLERSLELGADVVGGMPWYEGEVDAAKKHTDIVFELAKKYDRDIHALIDDNSDPSSKNIEYFLTKAIKEGFVGRVSASHCRGALDSPDETYARRIVGLARDAGATIVENSHISLFMYGRKDRHPVSRGVTRVKEFLEAGVNVAAGQDDIDDPYYPFGRGDMLEVAFVMCHAAHLGAPAELESAFDMITLNPAKGMGLKNYGLRVGANADLVLLNAHSVREALRLQPGCAAVVKGGKIVAESKRSIELHL